MDIDFSCCCCIAVGRRCGCFPNSPLRRHCSGARFQMRLISRLDWAAILVLAPCMARMILALFSPLLATLLSKTQTRRMSLDANVAPATDVD